MEYDRILIRYGEISTKGRNRNKFVDKLKRSIKTATASFPNIIIEAGRDRMFVLLNGENSQEIMNALKKVFGIQSFSPAIKVQRDIELIKESSLHLIKSLYKEGQTFKVSARRSDKKFELDTNQINHAVGAHILKNIEGIKVKVKYPDIDLKVEVR